MIHIKDVCKPFDSKVVLNKLNLEILSNEKVALLGQNGSGKTTLIRCILGLYRFDGDIVISGLSIKKNREDVLSKIAFVPQYPPQLKSTVAETVELVCRVCKISKENVWEITDELNLDTKNCLSLPFKSLSGGMKQKLLIALALARSPSILIMDEPTANLDSIAREKFLKLISSMPKHTTMILTSHRFDELAGIVQRVVELEHGKIVKDEIVSLQDGHDASKRVCILKLKRISNSIRKTLIEWSFKPMDNTELSWQGIINSADLFRFYSMLRNWIGYIDYLNMSYDHHEGGAL